MLSLLCVLALTLQTEGTPTRVWVRMEEPARHFYQVEMWFPASSETTRTLKMAVWTPGSYKVRDYAKNVHGFSAFEEDGEPLPWVKSDKTTWEIQTTPDRPFKVIYEVFAYEFTVRTSYLDSFQGFINPASVFLYEPSRADTPFEIVAVPGNGWKAASALPEIGTNTFRAANWDHFVDSPMEFGDFRRYDFEVRGISHHWLIAGDVDMNVSEMVTSLKKMGETVGDIFGHFPFTRYYIFSHFRLEPTGGGLEHANSTMVHGNALKMRTKEGWNGFLNLMFHEYIHSWNVKAIRDKVLGPFDYQKENYTELLWFHEGWTSYYNRILMRRAEFLSEKEFLGNIARDVDNYLKKPGIEIQSLADASFNAWIHLYQANEASANNRVSYYTDAAMTGFALDLLIRHRTKNEGSLDTVMRKLYEDHAMQGRGIDWADIEDAVFEVGGSGVREFLHTYVRQANRLPFETYLGYAGLELVYADDVAEEEDKGKDKDEKKDPKPFNPNPKVTMELSTTNDDGRVFVRNAKRDGPAWNAGLTFNDELLAIDGRRVTTGNMKDLLARARPGDEVPVLVAREGRVLTLDVTLKAEKGKPKLRKIEEMSTVQTKIYTALFGLKEPEAEKPEGEE